MSVRLSNLLGTLAVDCIILALGYFFNAKFVAISIVAFTSGRKVGWFLSKYVFFSAPMLLLIAYLVVYGGMIAMLVDLGIRYFVPGIVVKIIFGYGAGLYVSVPHYGLIQEGYVPRWLQSRDALMNILPVLAFIGFSVLFAFRPFHSSW